MADNPYRALPSIHQLKAEFESRAPLRGGVLTRFLQQFLDGEREAIHAGHLRTKADVRAALKASLTAFEPARLSPLINATGVVIHTNLGRALVSEETAAAMAVTAANAVALEIDPETNERGGRMREVSALMRLLTGAEATLVVNNNAAAVSLVLSALATGKSVIVSRGEAVEIGGGFRIPDVLRQSGARLIDVGTTNRTYPTDYDAAVDDATALFLKVHASNFAVQGFTTSTTVAELAPVAELRGIPIVEDLGSGALLDTSAFGLRREATVGESLSAGAAVVTFSGDKLLGGPQAGFICGTAGQIAKIERHPLARAVRADKTCLAGVAATLRHYAKDEAVEKIPVWRMISTSESSLRDRANALQSTLNCRGIACQPIESTSTIGGGALPGQQQPSVALSIHRRGSAVEDEARRLRTGTPGVFGRIENGQLLLDLRTVLPEHDDSLADAVVAALSEPARPPG